MFYTFNGSGSTICGEEAANLPNLIREHIVMKGVFMTLSRKNLLESLKGHLALLEKMFPKKAASPVARRVSRYVRAELAGSKR
jgi:hypothetical protein